MDSKFQVEKILIGQGKMAEVYLWNGFAYKCFRTGYPEDWIDYEMEIQNTISKTTLPTVSYYPSEIPNSIKMDFIDGITLADRIRRNKYKEGLKDLFSLFLQIHDIKNIELPQLSPYLINEISGLEIDPSLKELAESYISDIRDEDTLCHLDYHFLNLMYAEDQYFIIDWINAKIGNPIFDFARTYVIMYEFAHRLSKKFLVMAKEQCGFHSTELNKAIYVMALHRMSETDSPKIRQLIDELLL